MGSQFTLPMFRYVMRRYIGGSKNGLTDPGTGNPKPVKVMLERWQSGLLHPTVDRTGTNRVTSTASEGSNPFRSYFSLGHG